MFTEKVKENYLIMYGTFERNGIEKQKLLQNKSCSPVMYLCNALCRSKKAANEEIEKTNLARVLNIFDLTFLGVGSTLGVGIYVLAGEVAKNVSGPAVTIAFLLAAIVSVFAGLCYAEFGARVPRAGSAYAYSYYTVGEGIAFVIGWTLILEYGIGAASVAKGISTYIDAMANNTMSKALTDVVPMHSQYLSPFLDFFAFGLCIGLALFLAVGVKSSTLVNNIFTFINLGVVVFVIISGLFRADVKNWQIDPSTIPEGIDGGTGGFAPFGFMGIMEGAAICFYGFVGFDAIASTGEEVKNPQKSIPWAFVISLSIIFVAYFTMSSVLTLMYPYYLQDPDAPLPHVYKEIGWEVPRWIVSVGACFGLFSSLFGAMFPLPRIVYCMAVDGIIFRFLGTVNEKTKTPLWGTLVSGFVTAIMAAIFNLQQLVGMMALGTLLAYSIVAVCVLVLRYSPDAESESSIFVEERNRFNFKEALNLYINFRTKEPTFLTKTLVLVNILFFCALSLALGLIFYFLHENIFAGEGLEVAFLVLVVVLMLLTFTSILSQPKSKVILTFQMPLVPLLPCLSLLCNMYLMVLLSGTTWIRFTIWMAIGCIPYFIWYGWKYHNGEIGEHSRYEINRVNFIKLNDAILKIQRDKKSYQIEDHPILDLRESSLQVSVLVEDSRSETPHNDHKKDEMQLNYASIEQVDDSIVNQPEDIRASIREVFVIEDLNQKDDNNNSIDKNIIETEENNLDEVVNDSYGFLTDMSEELTNADAISDEVDEVQKNPAEELRLEETEKDKPVQIEVTKDQIPENELRKKETDVKNQEEPRTTKRLSEIYLENVRKQNESKKTEKDEIIFVNSNNIKERYLENIAEKEPAIPKPPPMPPSPLSENDRLKPVKKPLAKSNSRISAIYLEKIAKSNDNKTGDKNDVGRPRQSRNIPPPPPPPPIPPSSPNPQQPLPPKPTVSELSRVFLKPVPKPQEPKPVEKEVPFRDRLNNLLKDRISTNSPLSVQPSKESNLEETGDEIETSERYDIYKTIKTLSKAAMKDKLEFILTKGPPKRASFRNSFDIDVKRMNAVNALREIESQAIELNNENEPVSEKPNIEVTKETEEEEMARRQKMLMGNVLRTIKLKNKLNDEKFFKEEDFR